MKQKADPKRDGWYLATYYDFTGEYLFTKGKWWCDACIMGETVLQLCDRPDTWTRIKK